MYLYKEPRKTSAPPILYVSKVVLYPGDGQVLAPGPWFILTCTRLERILGREGGGVEKETGGRGLKMTSWYGADIDKQLLKYKDMVF